MRPSTPAPPGALVISLDFELLWGVRDLYPPDGGAYRANLLGARQVVPSLLDLFGEYEIAATWAAVGMLFAESREEMERWRPASAPRYLDARLSPYDDVVGEHERDDPVHFAPSLIAEIGRRRRQEVGSHTFSHYYPLEPGHDPAALRADLASAVAIARSHGMTVRSLVVPRNQFNPDYAAIIADAGFTCARTNANGWLYRAAAGEHYRRADVRAGRLIDNYAALTGDQVFRWDEIPVIDGLCCLPASHFLRPWSARLARLDPLRARRIIGGMRRAAAEGGLYHLWWHPHNFGINREQNLAFLRQILEAYQDCQLEFGMTSLSMGEAADAALGVDSRQAA